MSDDAPFDPWADLIVKLEAAKRELQALQSPLARRLLTGAHDDIADMLGVAPQELDGAFLEDEQPQEETPLLRRLRRGCDE